MYTIRTHIHVSKMKTIGHKNVGAYAFFLINLDLVKQTYPTHTRMCIQ